MAITNCLFTMKNNFRKLNWKRVIKSPTKNWFDIKNKISDLRHPDLEQALHTNPCPTWR